MARVGLAVMHDPRDAEPDMLAKVQTPGEPLVATHWTCPHCGFTKRGGPPLVCASDDPDCPVEAARG